MNTDKDIKQISVSTVIVATELNKGRVKELIQELQDLDAIDDSDAEVIKAATDYL
ncbi:hypothetical protein [Clostridium sp.]|jgi:hypothetical protein|uniref:hypothetical protein n=1 Tax=Clostridium sp. TaxID=1506 RepID=UPI0039F53A1C